MFNLNETKTGIQEIDLGGPSSVPSDVTRAGGYTTRPLHAALALSGGGATGSFEVGALQYLYSTGFFAKTISGTSVGAVNALKLAEGGTPVAQAAAFSSLLSIWRMISPSNPFYVQTPLLSEALKAKRDADRWIIDIIFNILVQPLGAATFANVVAEIAALIEPTLHTRALFDMSPLRTMIGAALNTAAVRTSGVSLRLCAANLESGEVRYVDQGGRLLNRDLEPIPTPLGTAPECQDLMKAYRTAVAAKAAIHASNYTDAEGFHRDLYLQDVREASDAVKQAQQALDACILVHPPVPQPLSLIDATMASAAIPVMFAPVAMAGETYVDGGVMLQLPIEAAVKADPDVIVAINTGKLTLDRQEGFPTANVLQIAERVVFGMMMPEAFARQIELAEKSGKPIFLISPRVAVHLLTDQDPGLLAINIDYGYMCAADTVGNMNWDSMVPANSPLTTSYFRNAPPEIHGRKTPIDPVLGALADAITRTRMLCWALEYDVQGERIPETLFGIRVTPPARPPSVTRVPDPDALDRLRELKTLVRILATVRFGLGGLLPPTWTSWWSQYEGHEFTNLGTPWDPFISVAGSRPAATPGTALVVVDSSGSNFLLTDAGRFPITNLSTVLKSGQPASIVAELFSAVPLGSPI